jgi:penicillin-binding protein 2
VGLERSYEKTLHGTPGHEILEVSAGGRPVRTLELEAAQPGSNLTLTIDLNLQRVAEKAMTGKTGSVIAIEPKTGRILAFASLPTYDPNLFPGGIDPESWNYLNTAEEKPLLNRAMRGIYPIGSTYKPFMALAGLELGAVTADYVLNDTGVFQVGNHKFRDVTGSPKGLLSLRKSIAVSSDIYYYWLATQLGVDKIHDFMQQWKFGAKTGIDLVGEQTSILPSRDWKEARFKEPWYVGDTPSLGIGQGYNAFTLLQLAHATATLANRGIIMTPHLVDKIENPVTGESIKVDAEPTGKIPLKDANLDVVIAGMTDVTRTGTARSVFQGAPYSVAGKTGTAQVISIAQDDRWDEKKVSRKHLDHALFIAFAPARNPRIAMAVLVENGGFGARAAAPVAKELMDYWLTGENSLGLPPPKNTPLISMKNAERKKP